MASVTSRRSPDAMTIRPDSEFPKLANDARCVLPEFVRQNEDSRPAALRPPRTPRRRRHGGGRSARALRRRETAGRSGSRRRPRDGPRRSLARLRLESPRPGRRREPEAPFARLADERSCDHVRGGLIEGRREPEDLVSRHPGRRTHLHDARAAVGERAGLVDDEGAHAGERLQRLAALHQDAGLGGPGHAGHDGDRDGEDQGTRASRRPARPARGSGLPSTARRRRPTTTVMTRNTIANRSASLAIGAFELRASSTSRTMPA